MSDLKSYLGYLPAELRAAFEEESETADTVDGASGVASLRTLGTGANQACAGDDARLLDSRVPSGAAGGDLGSTFPNPTVLAIHETSGPTKLTFGTILDGAVCQRSGTAIVGTFLSAAWDVTKVRYFLVDYDGGNDINLGYVDAAAGATLVPAGVAIKTFDNLLAILPTQGAGRRFKILVKNRTAGATYLGADGITPADVDLTRLTGFGPWSIWGSSDLTNNAADRINAGFIQGQVGPAAGGAWTVAAGATSQVFSIAAGALTAEPGLLGMRVRWLTGALAGQCQMVAVNSNTQITVGTAFTGAPAAGNTFAIERPGVRLNTLKVSAAPHGKTQPTVVVGMTTVADVDASLLLTGPGHLQASFCETLGTTAATRHLEISAARNVVATRTATDETGTSVSLGESVRINGSYIVTDCDTVQFNDYAHVEATGNANPHLDRVLFGQLGGGASYLGTSPGRLLVNACGATAAYGVPSGGSPGPVQLLVGSGVAATIKTRQQGGIRISNGGGLEISGVDFTNCITVACIACFGNIHNLKVDNCSGSSGNTGSGLSLPPEAGGTAILGIDAANTVTGTDGDVVLHETFGSNHWTSWAALAKVGSYITSTGLRIQALNSGSFSLSGPVSVCLTNQAGATVQAGELVRSNGTTDQFAGAQADTAAHATGLIGSMLTDPANTTRGLIAPAGAAIVQFSAAPTVGLMAYLDPSNARRAVTYTSVTGPPAAATNQKLRLGYVMSVSGTLGLVAWRPDNIPVTADGLP